MKKKNGEFLWRRGIKRVYDILVASLSILFFLPLFIIISIAIRLEDGGPIFFRQERIGYRGRPFMIYKFRSMVTNAEVDKNPQLCQKNDKRLTRVGNFIRIHHLDEFPQLINILKGEMSFVGPRPERKFFVDQIIQQDSRYILLYQLRPGVFSMATLYNGYTDTMEKMLRRLEMDLDYWDHCSVLVDFKIIVLTSCFIVLGKKF